MKNLQIAVIGDGGWGTTLAILLSKKGYSLRLWGAFPEYTELLDKKRTNPKFLPGIPIPKNIRITSDIHETLTNADIIILAVPSEYLRSVLREISPYDISKKSLWVSVVKGIENKTLMRMSEVITDVLGKVNVSCLSGPTIAMEVARDMPTTAVIASASRGQRLYLQRVFSTARFRVYTNPDIIGVELGGSLKNIIAIACGISDGLGFGTNAKAALLSRGLVEISKLGAAMGAKSRTFSGISGLGDLVTTCVSSLSRNRSLGEAIGKGDQLSALLKNLPTVAEGIPTARSAYQLSQKMKVEMPITTCVYKILFQKKNPKTAVGDLMLRMRKDE